MTGAHLLGYVGASGLLVMAPGPDFAVVMRNGLGGGRRSAQAAALGVTAGLVVWSVAVASGLATVLAASSTAYTAVKLVGVGYLMYLGLLSLRSAARGGSAPDAITAAATSPAKPLSSSFREGMLTNVLNPKVAATFLALMPQFLPPDPPASQLALLAVATVVFGAAWFQLVALVVGALKHALTRSVATRALDAVTGVVLVTFGFLLATD